LHHLFSGGLECWMVWSHPNIHPVKNHKRLLAFIVNGIVVDIVTDVICHCFFLIIVFERQDYVTHVTVALVVFILLRIGIVILAYSVLAFLD